MPLLPPAWYVSPVPLKRKRDTSAEPKRDPTKRAYMRIPDEAKLWFVDFHAYQARVHGKLVYNNRQGKHLVPELFGPWCLTHCADGTTAAHLTTAADHPWSYHHSPFRVSRTSHMPSRAGSASASLLGSTSTAVCCASSTSNSSPADDGRGSFCAACSSHGNSRRLAPARERKLLQLRVIHLCDRFKISQDRIWNLDETASCAHGSSRRAWVDQKSRASLCFRFARLRHGHTCCEHEGRHVDADRLRGEERPSAPSWTTLPAPARVSLPTHWITQDALLDMIDADMHAHPGDAELTPWFWIVRHSNLLRNFAAPCATPGRTSNCATSSGTSRDTLSRWTGRTCAPSRTRSVKRWPNTSPTSSSKPSPTSNMSMWTPAPQCSDSCCSHSCTQPHRTQTAHNIEPLAGASSIGTRWSSVSFSQKQNAFRRRENCFHENSRGASRARCRNPRQRQRARGACRGATGRRSQQRRRRGRAHWCRGISGTSGASSCRCSKESTHESA